MPKGTSSQEDSRGAARRYTPVGAPAERRRHQRTKLVLPVRVSSLDGAAQFSACTLDASQNGLRLHTRALRPGQFVEVYFQENHCRYRVAWVGSPFDDLPERCGLESLDGALLAEERTV